MSDDYNPWADATLWVIQTQYGSIVFYFNEEAALDRLTRTDRLFTCRTSDWKRVK